MPFPIQTPNSNRHTESASDPFLEENQDISQENFSEGSQTTTDSNLEDRPLTLSLASTASALETRGNEDIVNMFVLGRTSSPGRNTVPIFEANCASPSLTPLLTPLIGVGYTNGSHSGYYGAQNETIHLSLLLGGREVIGIYNDGEWRSSSFFCRNSQEEMSHTCEAILEVWESFFTQHAPGSTFIHYFFGNGADPVQEAIRHTRYANNIVLVGICPSRYPDHPRSFFYRVAGDLFSCLDSEGFARSEVTTLPYSSGSLGVFWVNFYDPAFNNAIVTTFMQIAGINSVAQNISEDNEIIESPLLEADVDNQEEHFGIIGHSLQGVTIARSTSPNVFTRIQTLLNMPETTIQVEENALPPEDFLDGFGEVVTNILRISDAVSILWIFPIVDTTVNASLLAVSIVFFGIDGLSRCFLMLTNPRSRRERYRNIRMVALCYHTLAPIMNIFDLVNNIRMASRSTATQCTVALYSIITFFGWTILGRDVLEYVLPRHRDALYTRYLRWFRNTREENERSQQENREGRIVVGRANLNNYYRVIGIVNTAVFGIFLSCLGGMATFAGLELSESCRHNATTNVTTPIIPSGNVTFLEGFTNGRAYAISQVVHMVFSLLAMIIYIMALIRMLRSNHRT
uniref:Transmembrane protein n=1 Tax=Chlamydia psittaci TaxID=83554 RepID=Q4FED7_CHLPS|nr:hypothetical protein [Chlamydia psittaci]